MKRILPKWGLLCGTLSTFLACSTITETEHISPDVEQPTQVERLSLDHSTWALPTELGQISQLLTTDTLTFLGTSAGLFTLMPQGVTRLDPAPVVAMCDFDGHLVVAKADGLFVWSDGVYLESSLNELLNGASINSLSASEDTLWLGTANGLFAYRDTELSHVVSDVAVKTVNTNSLGNRITYTTSDQSLHALEALEEVWRTLALSDDGISQVIPLKDTFLGILDDRVAVRKTTSEGSIWRGLSNAPDASEAMTGVSDIQSQGKSDTAWILRTTDIIAVHGGTQSVIERIDEVDDAKLITDSLNRVWLVGNNSLAVYGEEPPPTLTVNWDGAVEKFATENCTRCHGPLGTATPLHTKTQWQDASAEVLTQLTTNQMPLDGAPLRHGDAQLIREWIEGGMQ